MKKFASILLSMLMATSAIAAASAETYTGTAQGIGEVSVTLTVEDGKITAAEVVGESETKGIGYEPCADGTFADAIVAAQGVDFDSISGATVTSNAVKDAAKKAMAAAGLIEAEDTTVTDTECDVVIVGAGGAVVVVQPGDAPRVGTIQCAALGRAAVVNGTPGVASGNGVRHADQEPALPVGTAFGGRDLHAFALKRGKRSDHVVPDQFAFAQRDQIGQPEGDPFLRGSVEKIEQGHVVPVQHGAPEAAALAAAFAG